MAKRKGLTDYSDQELREELLRRNQTGIYRVYTHYPDSSREWWDQTFPTQMDAIAAVHKYQKVWSADPIYVVAPDGSEVGVEPLPKALGRCGICNNPNCDNPGGKH